MSGRYRPEVAFHPTMHFPANSLASPRWHQKPHERIQARTVFFFEPPAAGMTNNLAANLSKEHILIGVTVGQMGIGIRDIVSGGDAFHLIGVGAGSEAADILGKSLGPWKWRKLSPRMAGAPEISIKLCAIDFLLADQYYPSLSQRSSETVERPDFGSATSICSTVLYWPPMASFCPFFIFTTFSTAYYRALLAS